MATIVTRAGKGSPLTNTEVDANFTNLNNAKYEAGNNVSVGTLAASGAASFSAGSAGAPSITATGDLNTGMFFPAADTIAFAEGGVETMRLDASGNVGIGTASPVSIGGHSGLLTIYGANATGLIFQDAVGRRDIRFNDNELSIRDASGNGLFRFDANNQLGVGGTPNTWAAGYRIAQIGLGGIIESRDSDAGFAALVTNGYLANTGNWTYIASNAATRYYANAGVYVWQNAASGTAGGTFTWTERMRLDASGNLGIGTASPENLFQVSQRFSAGSDGTVRWGQDIRSATRSNSGLLTWDTNNMIIDAVGAGNVLTFRTSASDRMRIDATGVGIGTNSPASRLHVDGLNTVSDATVRISSTNYPSIDLYSANADAANRNWRISGVHNAYGLFEILQSSGQGGSPGISRFAIQGSTGNVGIATTSPTAILSLGGNSARTIWMERHTTADTAGNGLTVQAGGATSGATNKNGGNLVLSGGTATGSGESSIIFSTATASGAGTADRSPSEKMRLLGNGNLGIGTTTPVARFNARLDGISAAASIVGVFSSNSSTVGRGVALGFSGEGISGAIKCGIGNVRTGSWDISDLAFYANNAASSGDFTSSDERMRITSTGSVIINTAAIATNATDGFLYVPGCAGTPTGTPTAYTGRVPIVVDTTNNKLYFYSGGAWRDAGP